jgi:hypothetical protein
MSRVTKQFPQHLEGERAILGSILLNGVWPATLNIEESDFSAPEHKKVFRLLNRMREEGKPLDLVLIFEELKDDTELVAYISSLTEVRGKVANLSFYQDAVKRKAQLRAIAHYGETLTEMALQGGDDTEVLSSIAALPFPTGETRTVFAQLTCTPASEITVRPLLWFWKDRVPLNKLTLFCGDPDVGKSLTIADLVARSTTGSPWPDGAENSMPPSSVAMLCAEDTWEDIVVPRLIAAGADLSKVLRVDPIKVAFKGKTIERTLAFDTDIDAIKLMLRARPEIRLVVFDPLASYLGATNRNIEKEIRHILDGIKELAESMDVTIVVADHFNKTSLAQAIHRVSGSTSLVGAPRAVWGFLRNPDNPQERLMTPIKLNISKSRTGLRYSFGEKIITISNHKIPTPHIIWHGATETSADDIFARNADPEEKKTGRAAHWLKELLAGGPKPAAEIYAAGEKEGYDAQFLKRSVRARAGVEEPYQEGRRWWWKLPVLVEAVQ